MSRSDETFSPERWQVTDHADTVWRLATRTRARKYKRFLKGPVPEQWLLRAMRLPGKALAVGVLLWLEHGIAKRWTVRFCQERYAEEGISWRAAHRAIRVLEQAGLIEASSRPGCGLDVTILSPELEREW
jgi:hypothetical protein